MRNALMIATVAFVPALTGCSLNDLLFAAMSDHYSGGGHTLQDKQYDYDRRVEAAERHLEYR